MIFHNCLTTIFLVTALCILFDTSFANPGVRVQVTQKGFDYAARIGIDALYGKMKNIQIPDVEKNGRSYYRLSNMKVTSVSKPSGQVALLPGHGLKWQVSLNNLQISGDYRYSRKVWFTRIRSSGHMRLSMSGTRIEVVVVPTKASNGGLSIRATSCSCRTSIKIRVSNWFVRIILYFFRSRIARMMQSEICNKAVSTINNEVAAKVTNFPMMHSLLDGYILDYSLESNPAISANYLQTNHKAMIYLKNDKRSIPFSPKLLPYISGNEKMLYFEISNYVFDTWFFAAHQNGLLRYGLNPQTLPDDSRDFLQTTCPNSFCIGTVVPKIATQFPNHTLNIALQSYDRPQMKFLPNHIQLIFPASLQFSVVQPNRPSVPVFTVQLTFSPEVGVRFTGSIFMFSITKMSFKLGNITGPLAGDYDKVKFEMAIQKVADNIIPYLNQLGAYGMPILFPMGTVITNPEFRVANNAIILGADLTIKSI